MSHDPSPRRERRRARARAELLASARIVVAEKGLADVRVSDITNHADVALGTFYTHFASKDEMVESIVSDAISDLAAKTGDVGDQLDPAAGVSAGVRGLIGLATTDPDLARLLVGLEGAQPLFEGLVWERAERILVRGIDAGRFHVEDVSLTLGIAVLATFSTLRGLLENRLGDDAAELCSVVVLQSMGISPEEATAISYSTLPPLPSP